MFKNQKFPLADLVGFSIESESKVFTLEVLITVIFVRLVSDVGGNVDENIVVVCVVKTLVVCMVGA